MKHAMLAAITLLAFVPVSFSSELDRSELNELSIVLNKSDEKLAEEIFSNTNKVLSSELGAEAGGDGHEDIPMVSPPITPKAYDPNNPVDVFLSIKNDTKKTPTNTAKKQQNIVQNIKNRLDKAFPTENVQKEPL